ncbi:MAG: type II secretion system protein N [Hylemonella sp.]|uniref:type II secretion system protein N n=1 Tax=Hylemonella sp. TaxID=2066020 RepID=UPI0022C20B16|nr:type II secretion system protein N [Hylemonella sp.]MCZ8252321.1 type II secretion system protein N [Hylemonella sp.]
MQSSHPHAAHGFWRWACAGACLGAVMAVLLLAPARWLAWGLERLSAGQLQLRQVQGTLWDGSGELVLTGPPGSQGATRLPGRVQWRVQAAWDGLALRVQADCCMPQALRVRVRAQGRGLQFSAEDSASTWPMALFSGLGSPWNTVQLEGELQLRSRGLQAAWAGGTLQLQGELQLEARDLRSPLSTLKPVGSYRVTLDGGTRPRLQLETLSGSLQLSGQGHWSGSQLHFDGVAQAMPSHEAELSNLLNIIGRRDGARSILKVG